jgi:hypothetical protein
MTFDEWWDSEYASVLEWKHEARAGWDAALKYGAQKPSTNSAMVPCTECIRKHSVVHLCESCCAKHSIVYAQHQ